MSATLYLVPTPIGNLGDLSPRLPMGVGTRYRVALIFPLLCVF